MPVPVQKTTNHKFPLTNLIILWSIYALIALITLVGSYILYQREVTHEHSVAQEDNKDHANYANTHSIEVFDSVTADINILSAHKELDYYLRTHLDEHLKNFQNEVLAFAAYKKIYDQVSLIDNSGKELIKVKNVNGIPTIVNNDELLNLSNNQIVNEILKLKNKTLFTSNVLLSTDNNKIEVPYKPILVLGYPLFIDNQKAGALVAHYNLDGLLNSFKTFGMSEQTDFWLTTEDGFYIHNTDESKQWGFALENRQQFNLAKDHPEIWNQIKGNQNMEFHLGEGVYASTLLHPFEVDPTTTQFAGILNTSPNRIRWYYISFTADPFLHHDSRKLLDQLIVLDGSFLTVLLIVFILLHLLLAKRARDEKRIFDLNEILQLLNKTLRHDLSNKFTGISWGIENFKKAKDEKQIDSITELSTQGEQIIKNIKALENTITSSNTLRPIKLDDYLKPIISLYSQLKFSVTVPDTVLADEGLHVIFSNLIENAIRHGKATEITITSNLDNNDVIIRVSDNGSGIEDSIKNKLFQEGAFFGETGNTGFGLYIIRKTLERYGGQVWIEDNQPHGAIFVLKLKKG